jgi:hypothetical protein
MIAEFRNGINGILPSRNEKKVKGKKKQAYSKNSKFYISSTKKRN